MKRPGKWYRNNEKSVMNMLGLKPTPNSGSGWLVKEDGQNENIICQLKSTDNDSIKINKLDLDKLTYNSLVAHKLPVFAIQFIKSNEVYLVIKPDDLENVAKYITTGVKPDLGEVISIPDKQQAKPKKMIKSNKDVREAFMNDTIGKYMKKSKSAT